MKYKIINMIDLSKAAYKEAMTTGHWHRQIEFPNGERVMINSPHSIHYYKVMDPSDIHNIASVQV